MAWYCISDEPTKVTDIIQAVSVPLSLFLSWLIFRLGQNTERKKIKAEHFQSLAIDCESLVRKISEDGRKYLVNPPTANLEKAEIEVCLVGDLKRLSNLFVRLADLADLPETHFLKLHISFKESLTGTNIQFRSKKAQKLSPDDAKLATINSCAESLDKAIHEIRKNSI